MKEAQNRPYNRLSLDDALVLFVDHQVGLMSLVHDYTPVEFRNNVVALADAAKFFELPVILTTSNEEGPNGPLIPELRQRFPDAPVIVRSGEINAWDNNEFVTTVKSVGRRQIIIAGLVTDVCVAFPTLSALQEGFQVFVATDASGTFNKSVRDAALTRVTLAGAQLMGWFSIVSELMVDWRRDPDGLGRLLATHIPEYRDLITSYESKI